MMIWTVQLADGRTVEIGCDEVTTRTSGDLWFLRADKPPPDRLVPVAVFAPRTWSMVFAEGAAVVWPDEPEPEPDPKPAPMAL